MRGSWSAGELGHGCNQLGHWRYRKLDGRGQDTSGVDSPRTRIGIGSGQMLMSDIEQAETFNRIGFRVYRSVDPRATERRSQGPVVGRGFLSNSVGTKQ